MEDWGWREWWELLAVYLANTGVILLLQWAAG